MQHRRIKDQIEPIAKRARAMSDAAVQDYPAVLAAAEKVTRLDSQLADHGRIVVQPIREAIVSAEQQLKQVDEDLRVIADARGGLAVCILLGETDDAEDAEAQARHRDLERRRDLITLALPRLKEELKLKNAAGESISNRAADAAAELSAVREEAKIALAEIAYRGGA